MARKTKGKVSRKAAVKKRQRDHKFRRRMVAVLLFFFGLIFLPTSVVLFVGMMPTVVAVLVSSQGSKPITVGAINLAGASPFLLDLWSRGHSLSVSFDIIQNPTTIVVMYCAAAVGYLIDWSVTGIISTLLVQRGKSRKKAIKKQQEDLIDRWGKEVTGDYPMDEKGFSLEGAVPVTEEDAVTS